MIDFIKSVYAKPWLIMSGLYAVAVLGILLPNFAEWPIVPVTFLSLLPTFLKSVDSPHWDRFAAIMVGALSIQILFWIA